MSSEIKQTAIDVLSEVVEISGDRISPDEVEARLRGLVRGRPGVKLDVFWEEESWTGDPSYDALLRFRGKGAISIGWCADRGTPWSLRGATRWRDLDVVMVNQERLSISDVVEQLDFLWEEPGFAAWLVDYCLIREALKEDPQAFACSDEELQAAMDSFRKRRRLFTAQETARWMELHGMTHRSLEKLVAGQAQVTKLREHVIAGREEAYFAEHRADFDVASIARITVPKREQAWALCRRLRAGEIGALQAIAEGLEARPRSRFPWKAAPPAIVRVHRGELPAERAAAIFAAAPGTTLDPVEVGAGHELVHVIAVEPASFDAETRAAVRDRLFDGWLAERRAEARIEWLWGRDTRST